MSNKQLFIPDNIKVGFIERDGTYTGKLAFVIYFDKKGILRKEKEWSNWIDHKITPKDFKNEPTEGFVLNKKVGGYKTDWNFRKTYVRVYDPRDFEFEISIENLLFILENCSSIKGKGLEGQFVYSWNGKDLVLLPVNCENYKICSNFTALQAKKFSKKDLVAGNVYRDNKELEYLYIGRHNKFLLRNGYRSAIPDISKKHVFKELQNGIYKKSDDEQFRDFQFDKNINELVSEKHPQTAEATQDYYESFAGSKIIKVITEEIEPELVPANYSKVRYNTHWVFDQGFYKVITYSPTTYFDKNNRQKYWFHEKQYIINNNEIKQENHSLSNYDNKISKFCDSYFSSNNKNEFYLNENQHFNHYKPISVILELESGTKVSLEKYLGFDYYFERTH